MERKNKVWLIVLVILLILAMVGMVSFRVQLAGSQKEAAEAYSLFKEAEVNSDQLEQQLVMVQSELTEAQNQLVEAETALTESKTQVEALSSDLAAEQEKVAALEAAPAEIEAKVAELEAALVSANALIAELSSVEVTEDPVAEDAIVHVTEATQWRSIPGEEGQALADLGAGDELNYMNQTAIDALNNEWICAELSGQTGWIPAECAEIQSAEGEPVAETVAEPVAETATEPVAETATEPAVEPVAESVNGMQLAEAVDAINQKLAAIVGSDATDAEKLSQIADLEDQLSQTIADLTEVSEELKARSAALANAESELNAKNAEMEAANATIAELEGQLAEITAQTEEESAARAELEAQLATAQEACAALEIEQADARAEYEKHIAEMNAYLLSRELIDGEAHVATSAAREIAVESDGVTAAFDFTNTSVSGNAVVLTIVKGDVELYRSEIIQPGQSISEIMLAEALPAGAHEAIAVTTVYNEDGSVQLTSRVPVALNVAE